MQIRRRKSQPGEIISSHHLDKEVCGSILNPTYRMMLDGSIVA